MILHMPATDPAETAALEATRDAYTTAGRDLGNAELAAAARLVRKLMGEHSAELLVSRDARDGAADITLLVLLDTNRNPLWFNTESRYDCWDYPGAAAISDDHGRPVTDMERDVVYTIEHHLEDAYAAFPGTSGALAEDPLSQRFNEKVLLVLDIDDALRRVS